VIELWFGIVAITLTAYVVMDGFDFGAGALHLFVARTDTERRQVLAAIGPFRDGNEVFLLAAGGTLFLAFPKVLAAGLSGFYLAIFLVLWALILRGIAIEFRSHHTHVLWRAAWDAVFAVASTVLPVLFGAALGNLLRGLPLDQEGWFTLPLFTDFTANGAVGILDWYTVLVGVFALLAIVGHGAAYLTWKTDGAVHTRSRAVALWFYGAVAVLWPIVTLATAVVNRRMYDALLDRPLAWVALTIALGGLASVFLALRGHRPLPAFLGSGAFLGGLLAATAALVFPVMLRASGGGPLSLTAYETAVPAAGLRAALGWWAVAAPLVLAYFAVLFRLHRGKAIASQPGEGY
jgi:cytochrome d ubiquinol oxidase subunit II